MRPFRDVFVGCLIAIVLAASSFVAGTRSGDTTAGRFGELVETAEELSRRAAEEITDEQLARAAIRGMLEALEDPYAAVLSPRQERQVEDLLGGSIVGIGVWLEPVEGGLLVTSVVAGTPAATAGLRPGDVILEIDGRRVRDVERASERMRGPVGTTVTLGLRRDGEVLTVEVERAEIDLSDVQARMLEDGVAYARLLQFGRRASEELRRSLDRLLDEGADRVILDLRANAGGLADEAVRVASLFLGDGVVARIRERGEDERELRTKGEPLPSFPLVVLVDGGTASASELVAGALRDRGRATLVGTTTFGKGSVLTVHDLPDGEQIQYTTAYFFTPDGHPIEGLGIEPDVIVLPGTRGDPQLERALEILARP